jgi:hypothetical protein
MEENMPKSMGKASKEYLTLVAFLKNQPNGAELMWLEIEEKTGVTMDSSGKAKFRAAIKSCKRRYDVIAGIGVELDSPENTKSIADRSIRGIMSSIHRSRDTFDILANRHVDKLPPDEQQELRRRQAMSVAIDNTVNRSLILRKPERRLISQTAEHIPFLESPKEEKEHESR